MADKTFKLIFDIQAKADGMQEALSKMQSSFSKLNLSDTINKDLQKTFTQLNQELTNFKALTSKQIFNEKDLSEAVKSFETISKLYNKLRVQESQIKGIDPKKLVSNEALKDLKKLEELFSKVQNISFGNTKKEFNDLNNKIDEASNKLKILKAEKDKAVKTLETKETTRDNALERVEKQKIEVERLKQAYEELNEVKGKKRNEEEIEASRERWSKAEDALQKLTRQYQQAATAADKAAEKVTAAEAEWEKQSIILKQLRQDLKNFGTDAQKIEEVRTQLAELTGLDISKIPQDIKELEEFISNLSTGKLKEIPEVFKELSNAADQADKNVQDLNAEVNKNKNLGQGYAEQARDIEQLANRVKYFFSITNSVMLFRRAVKSAISTIKELDEVMTQTAVVTKYTVNDMWRQLPQYAKIANELGVSLKGVYEASTLYYQQGLKTNEVIGVSTETLKMAKIAGLDYATATDYMTSALRGFNMEVNEVSAQKVNDIYSQLAAHTASNVEEISTAMSKVAPLAHNAGMEIETTAAMLAQMIERTREAPETLGTAMKTVIARFQELKKAPSEIEEIDGEIVDANKVEKALRTVGISLRDTSGQFRELDDVFLELSSKWDTLDVNTQRYIATIAAGSRQQSRFIAMMADYKRTAELVTMANNSAGASQEQFEKTQASMETAVNRLKVAWNQFTMGLANNQIIKLCINLLTEFIKIINKAIDTLSLGSGLLKSFWSIFASAAGIKLARAAFNGFFNWLLSTSKIEGLKAGVAVGTGFNEGFKKNLKSIKNIFKDEDTTKNLKESYKALSELKLGDIDTPFSKETINLAKNYSKELEKVGKSLELTSDQQEISNLLQQNGVSVGLANAAAVSSLTEEEIEEAIATVGGTEADKEALRVQLEKISADKAEAFSTGEVTKTEKLGLITKLKYIAALLFGSEETRKDAFAKLGLAGATYTAKTAEDAFNKSIYASPLGPYLIVVLALVAAFAALAIHLKNISLSNRIKAAEEETNRAKDAANKAKEAYDELLEKQEGYDETQQALKDLTYGTQEWKQALVEANQQVLELLQTYPELSRHLNKGVYGQLTIDAKGWEEIIKNQQASVIRAQGSAAQSQIQLYGLQNEQLGQNLNNKFSYSDRDEGDYAGASNTTVDFAVRDKVRQLIDEGFTGDFAAEIKQLGITTQLTSKEINEAAIAMMEYDQAIAENQILMENSAKAFLTTALDTNSTDQIKTTGIVENIVNTFSKSLVDESNTALNDMASKIKTDKGKRAEIANKLGIVLGDNASDEEQLQQIYAKLTNQTLQEVKDLKLSKDQLAKGIAKYQNSDEVVEAMNKFAKSFSTLGKETQEKLNLAMSEGASYIEGSDKLIEDFVEGLDLTKVKDDTYESIAVALIKGLTEDEIKAIELIYGSLTNYAKAYAQAVQNGKTEIDGVQKSLEGILKDPNSFGQNLTADAIKGLSDHLLQVYEVSGKAAAEKMAGIITNITKDMEPDKANKFAAALNGIDWKNADSVEGLSDIIKDLGLESGLSEEDIDALEIQIKDLAKATREVDLEKLIEQIRSLAKISIQLKNGEQTRRFSEENKDLLIENAGLDEFDFQYDFETGEYVYVGDSMVALTEAVDRAIEAINGNTEAELNKKIASGQAAKDAIDNAGDEEGALQRYIGTAGENNTIISQDKLNEIRKIEDAEEKEAELQKYYNELLIESNKLQGYINDKKRIELDMNSSKYQGQNNNSILKSIGNEIDFSEGSEGRVAANELYLQAEAVGVAKDTLDEYIEVLNTADAAEIQLASSNLSLLITQIRQTNGIKKLVDGYDDWYAVLKKINQGDLKIKDMVDTEDIEKINDLKKALKELTNTEMEVSDSFLENEANQQILDDVANGIEGSIDRLRKVMAEDAWNQIKIGVEIDSEEEQKAFDDFEEALANFDPGDIEVGAALNDGPFINALNSLLRNTKVSVEQVNDMLSKMGFDFEIVGWRNIPFPNVNELYNAAGYTNAGGAARADAQGVGNFQVKFPIIRSKKLDSPSYSGVGGGSSGGGGGGGGGSDETWENPYDWLYNLTEKINAELRIREKLERRYQRLLKNYSGSGAELKQITDNEIASLNKRLKLEEEMLELRKKELKEYLALNEAMSKYATVNWELEIVQINWDAINAVTDTEEGEAIEKYVEKIESILEEILQAEDAIEDIGDDLDELKWRGEEAYRDLEDRVLAALISEQQDMIDEQKRIYDAINDAASDLMDAISKNIEKIRQDRQNEETETSLAEKERRLAYLRQDTTGSNALEIKKLEQELDKEKQNYTDTLIDQSLNDLKEQNDAAAKQRDKQIELMQSTLDWQEKTGYYVDEATDIVRRGLGPNGVIDQSSRMYRLLQIQEGVPSMSNASRDQWNRDLANTVSQAFVWLENYLGGNGGDQSPENRDYMSEMIGQSNKGRLVNLGENMKTMEQLENARNAKIDSQGLEGTWAKTHMVENYKEGMSSYNSAQDANVDWMANINKAIASEDWASAFFYAGKRDAKIANDPVNANYASDFTFDIVFDKWYAATKSMGRSFKTGGLADFTGPAWLDGTKAKPEAVLNARDTENFIQLRDVLSNLRSNIAGMTRGSGDWYFDIDINVDEISDDYDVDQLTERVKQSIYTEATYRNVNAINFLK